ncbi:MAG: AlbA family DNA-binding domain-containing protein [Dehalococcoidia bacterium]
MRQEDLTRQAAQLTQEEVRTLVAIGHEQSGVEFKGPGKLSDTAFVAKVIKAALAMANRRNGGLVIVGVSDHGLTVQSEGLTEDQLGSWNHDDFADVVRVYADPVMMFDWQLTAWEPRLVIIRVHEFSDVPVFCDKTYQDPTTKKEVLKKGALYIRPNGKPSSVEIATAEDLRELLEVALEKKLSKWVSQAARAGLLPLLPRTAPNSDAERFRTELGDLA